MPRMKSVGFDAALRVLISRLGVYSARSAMFWIRSALISAVLKLVPEIARSLRRSSRPVPRTIISSMSALGSGTAAASASLGNNISRPSEAAPVGSSASWAPAAEVADTRKRSSSNLHLRNKVNSILLGFIGYSRTDPG